MRLPRASASLTSGRKSVRTTCSQVSHTAAQSVRDWGTGDRKDDAAPLSAARCYAPPKGASRASTASLGNAGSGQFRSWLRFQHHILQGNRDGEGNGLISGGGLSRCPRFLYL